MGDSVVSDLDSLELGLPGALSLKLNGPELETGPPRPRPRPPSPPNPEEVENGTTVLLVPLQILVLEILIPIVPLIDNGKTKGLLQRVKRFQQNEADIKIRVGTFYPVGSDQNVTRLAQTTRREYQIY